MALRRIAVIGHPVLRQRARLITREELATERCQGLIDDLVETMREVHGAGLAAPQIHEPVHVCAIEVSANPRYPYMPAIPLTILVNARVTPLGPDTFENYEGCLSVPDLRGRVRRFAHVRIDAWDRHGASLEIVARGITAGTFQHELDHLDGTLFVDRVEDPRSLATWREYERHHQRAFVAEAEAIVARWGS
jgi:peptide deformylase